MIGNNWNASESISQKMMNRVKPDEPLKNKIDFAQKKLQFQISKLDSIGQNLQKKHDMIFEKIVVAQRSRKTGYAHAYASELAQVRKMKNMISGAKLSMEQIKIRLDTVAELGDVVVTLSPCMSIIKGLSPQLSGLMPEANASMQDLSQLLGDVVSGSSVDVGVGFASTPEPTADTMAILNEAHGVIAGQAATSIPDVPDSLKGMPDAARAAPGHMVQSNIAPGRMAPDHAPMPDMPGSPGRMQDTAHITQNHIPQNHVPPSHVPQNHVPQNHVPQSHAPIPDVPDRLKRMPDAAQNHADLGHAPIPDVPDSLKHQIVQRRTGVFV